MTNKKTAPAKSGASSAKKTSTRKAKETVVEKSAVKPSEEVLDNGKIELKAFDYPPISVVIPFRKDKAKGEELLYAVRAWAKNYPQAKIVVIGDGLPWFGKEIVHIPFEDTSDNAQVNTTGKIMAAIASEDVTEHFILSCDDIYPVTPLDASDIGLLRCNFTPLAERKARGGHFQKNLERTVVALKAAGFDNPHDYDTHTPYLYNKEALADIIAYYDCAGDEAKLLPSLYFNTFYPDIIPLRLDITRGQYIGRVINENGNNNVLAKAFEERKFINHDSNCYKRCEPFLKAKFSEKCRFEK